MSKKKKDKDIRTYKFEECFVRGKFPENMLEYRFKKEEYAKLYELIGFITICFSKFENMMMQKNLTNGYSRKEMEEAWNDDKKFLEYQKFRFPTKKLYKKIEELEISNERKKVLHCLRLERNGLSHALATYMPYIEGLDIKSTIIKLEEYSKYIDISLIFSAILRSDIKGEKLPDNVEKIIMNFIVNYDGITPEVDNTYKIISENIVTMIKSGVEYNAY